MLGRRGVPGGLPAGRAWRWCVLRTVRNARIARRKGRPIAGHHLGRLFARRWVGFENILGVDEWRKLLNQGIEHISNWERINVMSESKSNAKSLTYELLKNAIAGNAAAIRCRSILQPAAGEGTKVFPPTHSGGAYATER